MKRLDVKTAVVTGASSGIGRAIVEQFVAEGARVFTFSRNTEALKARQDAHPERVIAIGGGVTRQEDLKHLVDSVLKSVDAIDFLIPNAGIDRVVSFEDSTADAFFEQFSVNLFGAAGGSRRVRPSCLPPADEHLRSGLPCPEPLYQAGIGEPSAFDKRVLSNVRLFHKYCSSWHLNSPMMHDVRQRKPLCA